MKIQHQLPLFAIFVACTFVQVTCQEDAEDALKQVFKDHDKDSSGKLSHSETLAFFENIWKFADGYDLKPLQNVVNEVGKDINDYIKKVGGEDKEIDEGEFKGAMKGIGALIYDANAWTATFMRADHNEDFFLDDTELSKALGEVYGYAEITHNRLAMDVLNSFGKNQEECVKNIRIEADSNKDEKLSIQEWKGLCIEIVSYFPATEFSGLFHYVLRDHHPDHHHDDKKPNHDDHHDDKNPNHGDNKPNHGDNKPNHDGTKPNPGEHHDDTKQADHKNHHEHPQHH